MGDVDFAAEGLLDGLDDDRARSARKALLRKLLDDGVPLEELRQACAEDRLVLIPVDRALSPQAKYDRHDLSELSGLDTDVLRQTRAAFGLPVAPDDARVYGERDLEISGGGLKALLDLGVPLERILELNRVIGRAMLQAAAASRAIVGEALLQPGLTEEEAAELAANAAKELVPSMAPVLEYVYAEHLRELLRNDVISAGDIAAGRTGNAREITVAFADLVGFTRLGEELPPEDLDAVARRLEQIAAERIEPPVTLVKTVGDAVMLVAPETDPLLDTVLGLIEAGDEDEALPRIRVGLARGHALERAGDYYGSPVNTASRVTGVARPGSVLVTEDTKENAEDGWYWSFAGERKLKGVGSKKLFRARRSAPDEG